MNYCDHPIENLSAALHHAVYVALPEIEYETRDWDAISKMTAMQRKQAGDNLPMQIKVRRPQLREVMVSAMFPQNWGSTALGFGGLGGAAVTTAYTVILQGPQGDVLVYWNSRLAYRIDADNVEGRKALQEDTCANVPRTAARNEAIKRYGAIVDNS